MLPEWLEDAGYNESREAYEGEVPMQEPPLDFCTLCEYPESNCTC